MQYSQLRQKIYQQNNALPSKQKNADGLSSAERLTLLMQAISTCHAVSIQDGELLASSPDEVALVKFAQEAGLQMVYRDDNMMKIVDRNY